MKQSALAISCATLLMTACAHHAPKPGEDSAQELKNSLECKRKAEPEEIQRWVSALGGLSVVHSDLPGHAEYTLPRPVSVFGQDVQRISASPAFDDYGEYIEYSSFFNEEDIDTVARFAQMAPSYDNEYQYQILARDLTLRPEAGDTYIVCANHVRSLGKSIRYWLYRFDDWVNPNGVDPKAGQQHNRYHDFTQVEHFEMKRQHLRSPSFSFDPPEPVYKEP